MKNFMQVCSFVGFIVLYPLIASAAGTQIEQGQSFVVRWDSNPAAENVDKYSANVSTSNDPAIVCDVSQPNTWANTSVTPAVTPGPGAESFTFPSGTGFDNTVIGQYYAGVVANNAQGWSTCSAVVPFEIVAPATAPTPPQGVVIEIVI